MGLSEVSYASHRCIDRFERGTVGPRGCFFHHQQKTYVSDTYDPLRPLTAVHVHAVVFGAGTTPSPESLPSRRNSLIPSLLPPFFEGVFGREP